MNQNQTAENPEAFNRYWVGKGYMEAAKYIISNAHYNAPGAKDLLLLPLNTLAGFALELFFKSWLLQAGEASSTVKKFSHDVEGLFKASLEKELPHIEGLSTLVEIIGPGHKSLSNRYAEDGMTFQQLHDWATALKAIDSLDEVVDFRVGASASFRLEPHH